MKIKKDMHTVFFNNDFRKKSNLSQKLLFRKSNCLKINLIRKKQLSQNFSHFKDH